MSCSNIFSSLTRTVSVCVGGSFYWVSANAEGCVHSSIHPFILPLPFDHLHTFLMLMFHVNRDSERCWLAGCVFCSTRAISIFANCPLICQSNENRNNLMYSNVLVKSHSIFLPVCLSVCPSVDLTFHQLICQIRNLTSIDGRMRAL